MKKIDNRLKDSSVMIAISRKSFPGNVFILFPVLRDLGRVEILWTGSKGDCLSESGRYYVVLQISCNPFKRLGKFSVLARLKEIKEWYAFNIFYVSVERSGKYYSTSEGYTIEYLDRASIPKSVPENLMRSVGGFKGNVELCLLEVLQETYG